MSKISMNGLSLMDTINNVEDINLCQKVCCETSNFNEIDHLYCNVIFHFNHSCYLFYCKSLSICPLRPYFGQHIQPTVSIHTFLYDDYIKNNIETSTSIFKLNNINYRQAFQNFTILHDVQFLNISTNVEFILLDNTNNITRCKVFCVMVENSNCNAVIILKNSCFAVKCMGNLGDCGYIKTNTLFNNNLLITTNSFKAVIDSPNECYAVNIMPNSRLTRGLDAGTYVNLGHLDTVDDCIQSACSLQTHSNIIYYIDKLCLGISCFSNFSCSVESLPENNGSKKNLNSTVIILHNNQLITTNNSQITEIQIGNYNNITYKCYSHSSLVGTLMKNQSKNLAKFQGSAFSMIECVSRCCIFENCDIAYLEEDACYIQICKEPIHCLLYETNNILSTITYITRSPFDEFPEFKAVTPCNDLLKITFFTATNLQTLNSNNFHKFLGIFKNITQCYNSCCKIEPCDTIFYIGKSCWGYHCNNMQECTLINDPDILETGIVVPYLKNNQYSLTYKISIIIICLVLTFSIIIGIIGRLIFLKKKI